MGDTTRLVPGAAATRSYSTRRLRVKSTGTARKNGCVDTLGVGSVGLSALAGRLPSLVTALQTEVLVGLTPTGGLFRGR
jgi:hypothetical protein